MAPGKDVPLESRPDVYGQVHAIENAELLARKLKEFRNEVDALPEAKKEWLRQAEDRCPELLTEDFLLLFLRCEVFNAKMAAKRYAKYWQRRVEIFGDRAFEPLTLSGNCQDIYDYLATSFLTILEPTAAETSSNNNSSTTFSSQKCERTLLFVQPHNFDPQIITCENLVVKTLWFVTHVALENTETAKRGFITISHPQRTKLERMRLACKFLPAVMDSVSSALPMRLSAYHVCHPPTFFRVILPLVRLIIGERMAKRVLAHPGTSDEVLGKLLSYGFSMENIPESLGGDRPAQMLKWLEERKQKEMMSMQSRARARGRIQVVPTSPIKSSISMAVGVF